MLRRALLGLVALLPLALARPALAAEAPAEIKIGHLHAGSGAVRQHFHAGLSTG